MQLIENLMRLKSQKRRKLQNLYQFTTIFVFLGGEFFLGVLVECFNALEALVESLGTLMGMGAGAAETELTMREEHFKVGAESDGRKVGCFQKDKHQPSQTKM